MTPTILDTPCIEWTNERNKAGYGRRWIKRNGKRVKEYVHRWVWEQINGPIPGGLCILHKCDNPPCFRYDHLRLGTHADNAADRIAKGRPHGNGKRPKRATCRAWGHPIKEGPNGHRYCPTCQEHRRRERQPPRRKR